MSQSPAVATNERSGEWIDSIERLICWIAPRTRGRQHVLQLLADVKDARPETHRLHAALCLLSHHLDALYPQGAVISLAKQRVRNLAMALDRHGGIWTPLRAARRAETTTGRQH
jgi:hypothetical protein